MPVTIDRPAFSSRPRISDIRERRAKRGTIRDRGRRITIGLVNNMPDGALVATERQFSRLIESGAGDADIRLRFYSLTQIPRSPEAMEHLNQLYADATGLHGQKVDALIVTGAQPIAPDLRAEPYWDALTDVIDWAEANTISTILSCLAAHAGVLHLNGLARRPLEAKCSGVYAFDLERADPLTEGADGRWLTPHSRYNGLDEKELAWNDYKILTRSRDVGVDIFTKQLRSLLVFLQGHPEYENETLAREYRRDLSRFLKGDLIQPPRLPDNYFSADAAYAWLNVQAQADRGERIEALPEIQGGDASWRPFADLLYRNWLSLVADRKARASQDSSALVARWGG